MLARIKDIVKRFNGEIPTSELVKRGMKVGKDFNRQQGCYIDPTHCFLITIGDNVTLSIRVTLMAHDASTKKLMGYTKIGKITIGNNVFVGANSTILPGISVGDNAVIGANSVVTKDVEPGMVVAGNPARPIMTVEQYKKKNIIHDQTKVFDQSYRFSKSLPEEKKQKIIDSVKDGIAYIE